ncbi:hypothetical protein GLOTRDRAFT_141475 [Gloeophyllum trabeum ATCC 11539]|uniref:Fungal-type protein kinase domain-containing protein n=1 Tax=Gloeophyllum trabeum (strain ATCC 11539 / FP-39264 / Madison 617) TaxID=670483 RepID=S7PRH9_GLOTA|nr:uncharacterized protein GLOTRDRAFT_141475 [Gloeophyllum trabeum ATCC 11539]EPQ50466.1 hypothetical protein GLOTRDRAFT_141475 [Gloeophyllum trabeum ATCC 11539]
MATPPPPSPSVAPPSPSSGPPDSPRPTTPDATFESAAANVSNAPATPTAGKITKKPAHTTPHKLQDSLTSVTQYESSKREKGFHRTVSGSEAAKHTHSAMKLDSFLSLCFPNTEHNEVFDTFKDTHLEEFQQRLGKVKLGPKHNRERPMYARISNALQYVFDTLNADGNLLDLYVQDVSRDLQSGDQNLREIAPDLDIRLKNDKGDGLPWTQALGIIEVKKTRAEDPLQEDKVTTRMAQGHVATWNRTMEQATVAFQARPRCHLIGIGFYKDIARFYRWDRSAVTFSTSFAYKADCKPLVKFLYGFSTFGLAGTGIDTTITCPVPDAIPRPILKRKFDDAMKDNLIDPMKVIKDEELRSSSFLISVPLNEEARSESRWAEKYVTLGKPLFTSRSLHGRGTRTWLAMQTAVIDSRHAEGYQPERYVIIKDSWRDSDRLSESEIYERIHEGGHMFGVARCRRGVDVVPRPPQETEDSGPPKEAVNTHRTCASSLNELRTKAGLKAKYVERIHYRCILESVGIPLTRFRSTRELLEAVRDAVKGHEGMLAKKILHRDISVNNIMINAYPNETYTEKGFLIDPEYAAFLNDKTATSDLRRITGTIQFIAVALQQKLESDGQHKAWHDLESVYWVLIYTAGRHTKTNIPVLARIFDGEDGEGKGSFVLTRCTTITVDGHAPLTECLRKYGKLVRTHYLPDEVPIEYRNKLTHDAVLKLFEDALDSPDWPKDDPPARPYQLDDDATTQRNNITASDKTSTTRSAQESGMSGTAQPGGANPSCSRKRKRSLHGAEASDQSQAHSSGSKRARG